MAASFTLYFVLQVSKWLVLLLSSGLSSIWKKLIFILDKFPVLNYFPSFMGFISYAGMYSHASFLDLLSRSCTFYLIVSFFFYIFALCFEVFIHSFIF